jgi:3-oxoadipate enol-lactonase
VVSGTIDAGGIQIYYEEAGSGSALVLLHEGLADSRMYDPQFAVFAERYRVVRYDLPGYGRSASPDRPFSHHDVLYRLLRSLDIDRAAVLGMSLGGSVAIDFALTDPSMVSALLLLASGLGGYPMSAEMHALTGPIMQAFEAGDFDRVIDLTIRLWLDGPQRGPAEVDPGVHEGLRNMYMQVLRRSREGVQQADQLRPPAYTRLQEIHAPTLIVVGAGDVPDIRAGAELLERSIEGAQKVVLPRVAHVFNMEIPDETNRIVLEFLRDHIS